MGIYLNFGKQSFQMTLNSEIFVDKSEMLWHLNQVVNTQHRFVCVTRPRRFGKSMAADMICAYYDREAESRELFSGLKVAMREPDAATGPELRWDTYLGQFDVIRIVMPKFFDQETTVTEALKKLQKLVARDLKKAYPEVDFLDDKDLIQSIEDVYSSNERQVVFVIDEWDALFRMRQSDKEGQTEYLNFLRNLLKDNPYVSLAYMTGILPIKKCGEHSALNMFDEYSMTQPMCLAEYVGFTEKEVQELCVVYEMSFEEVSAWYDGYRVSDFIPVGKRRAFRLGEYTDHMFSVYSPLSVVKAMRSGMVDAYWNKTETYEALSNFIQMDFDGLKDTIELLMDGARVKVNLKGYQNDMSSFHNKDDVLALLIHLGYLGFEGNKIQGRIESDQGEVFIPNREILEAFRTSAESQEWAGTFEQFQTSQEL